MWRSRTADHGAGQPCPARIASGASHLATSRRIAIVGNQGAGKTTLARRVASLTGRPFFDVDPDVPAPGLTGNAQVGLPTGKDDWVIDGDFGLCTLADTVIHLDFPKHVCVWRATKRAVRGGCGILATELGRPDRLARRAWVGLRAMLRVVREIVGFEGVRQGHPASRDRSSAPRCTIVLRTPREVDLLLHALQSVRR